MKILFLPNWKIEYCERTPTDKQPPDYYVNGNDYWFFRYFEGNPQVDVIDVSSFSWLENFERKGMRFYIWQALKAIPKLNKYDFVISHGMQSGVVVSLWRRFFKTRAKHIVFEIGSFNSASESGAALKLMQFASKSIDGIIYHTSRQKDYYAKCFPWIIDRSRFIRFGTDSEFFNCHRNTEMTFDDIDSSPYCICVGYSKRDWDTVVKAFELSGVNDLKLRLIGHVEDRYSGNPLIQQMPYVPVNELVSNIEGAKFAILPLKSFNYSYGQMTLLQQMALGKCVIASRVPSLVDYGTDRENIVFYDPENTEDLAKKIKLVNSDSEFRLEIGARAADFVMNECNEKTMAREIEDFINENT